MELLVDIFVTSKSRPNLLQECLSSITKNTKRSQYRLTVVQDGHDKTCEEVISSFDVDHTIILKENSGLGPAINAALAHIKSLDDWNSDQNAYNPSGVSHFICYIQDDVVVTPDWLPKMTKFFTLFEQQKNIGFASGVECVEHKSTEELILGQDKILFKPWIRAANMFARSDYWFSMFPISRFDPETRNIRAKPNDGIGSGVDWWFIRNHRNSVCQTGRQCLVIPGMMLHIGFDKSTWLNRALPESLEDRKKIAEITCAQVIPGSFIACGEGDDVRFYCSKRCEDIDKETRR